MTSWIDFAYTAVALIVAALLVYVMQKTEHDRVNKFDAAPLQWFRRLSFIFAALALLYSIQSANWQLTCLLLVGASGGILVINAVALHMRTPPATGSKIRNPSPVKSPYSIGRLVSYFIEAKK